MVKKLELDRTATPNAAAQEDKALGASRRLGKRRDVLLRSRQARRNAMAALGKSAPDGLKPPDKELEQISTQLDMMLRAAGRGSRAR